MDLIKKHIENVIILAGILSSVFWMNHKFTDVDERFVSAEKDISLRFISVEKEISFMKSSIDLRFAEIEKELSFMKCSFDLRFAEIEKQLAIMKAVLMVKGQFPKELMAATDEKNKVKME